MKRSKVPRKVIISIGAFLIGVPLVLGIILQIYITQKASTVPDITKKINPQELQLNSEYQEYYEEVKYEDLSEGFIKGLEAGNPSFWRFLEDKYLLTYLCFLMDMSKMNYPMHIYPLKAESLKGWKRTQYEKWR